MSANNDPFPRDEVTGLAAFDDLDPVNSIAAEFSEGTSAAVAPVSQSSAIRRTDPALQQAEGAPATKAEASGRVPAALDPVDAEITVPVQTQADWDPMAVTVVTPESNLRQVMAAAVSGKCPLTESRPSAESETIELQDNDVLSTAEAGANLVDWDEDDEPRTSTQPGTGDGGTNLHNRTIIGLPRSVAPGPVAPGSDDGSDLSQQVVREELEHPVPVHVQLTELVGRGASSSPRLPTAALNTGTSHMLTHVSARPDSLPPEASVPPAKTTSRQRQVQGSAPPVSRTSPASRTSVAARPDPTPVPRSDPSLVVDRASVGPGARRLRLKELASDKLARAGVDRHAEPTREVYLYDKHHRRQGWEWSRTLAAVVGLCLLVGWMRSKHEPNIGTVMVVTNPPDAKVTVDGQAVSGTSSPYTSKALTPGDHVLAVSKEGYADYRGTFIVSKGENKTLPVVDLVSKEAGFSVRSTPSGAEIWVDGKPTDQVTPAVVSGVSPGIHSMLLKYEGRADYELRLFVPEGTLLTLPDVVLCTFSGKCPPLNVSDRARIARASAKTTPRAVGADAKASGLTDTAEAERAESSAAAPRTPETLRASAAAARHAGPDVNNAANKPRGGTGTLRINSRPWARVIVDGKDVGTTPQLGLQLPAGKHRVKLVNEPMAMSKTIRVSIAPGETQTQIVNLAE